MKHHAFLACHPAVNLLYFVLVLTFSMFSCTRSALPSRSALRSGVPRS